MTREQAEVFAAIYAPIIEGIASIDPSDPQAITKVASVVKKATDVINPGIINGSITAASVSQVLAEVQDALNNAANYITIDIKPIDTNVETKPTGATGGTGG